jgi:hypothetical protein
MGATSLVKVTSPRLDVWGGVCALKPPLATIMSIRAGQPADTRSQDQPLEVTFMSISPFHAAIEII